MRNNYYLCISPKKTSTMKEFKYKIISKRTFFDEKLEITSVRFCKNWEIVTLYLSNLSETQNTNKKIEITIEELNNEEEE